ncbi:MAG: PRC-barrel domain-containing protein [Salinarchaeum sp.]
MQQILAKQLSEKAVIGTDGTEIGSLYNVTMDIDTGRLEYLIVSANNAAAELDFETDQQGRYLIPQHLVESVKDHLVINLQ